MRIKRALDKSAMAFSRFQWCPGTRFKQCLRLRRNSDIAIRRGGCHSLTNMLHSVYKKGKSSSIASKCATAGEEFCHDATDRSLIYLPQVAYCPKISIVASVMENFPRPHDSESIHAQQKCNMTQHAEDKPTTVNGTANKSGVRWNPSRGCRIILARLVLANHNAGTVKLVEQLGSQSTERHNVSKSPKSSHSAARGVISVVGIIESHDLYLSLSKKACSYGNAREIMKGLAPTQSQ